MWSENYFDFEKDVASDTEIQKITSEYSTNKDIDFIKDIPPGDRNRIYDIIKNKHAKRLAKLFSEATQELKNNPQKGISDIRNLQTLYTKLQKYNLHGLVFSFLKENNLPVHGDQFVNPESLKNKFSLKIADFLPEGKDITPSDVDPTLHFFEKTTQEDIKKKVDKIDTKKSYWADERRFKIFRTVLDMPSVRKFLQTQPHLSLAGAFSVIKSTILYQKRERGVQKAGDLNEQTIRLDLEKICKEREKFSQQVLLDNTTKQTRFYGERSPEEKAEDIKDGKRSNLFTPGVMNKISDTLGVQRGTIFELEKGGKSDREKFLTSIKNAEPGKRFVYIDAHGDKESFGHYSENSINANTFAQALIENYTNVAKKYGPEKAQQVFKDTVIYGAPCHFNDVVYDKLASLLPKNLKGVVLPRFIGLSSLGTSVYDYVEEILPTKTYLAKTKKLTGADLLAIDDEHYHRGGDMMFSSQTSDTIYPISQRLDRSTQNEPDIDRSATV
jgi:hypothetical protein